MRVRPDPLILGKEFADEAGGTESHSAGDPGAARSMFFLSLHARQISHLSPTKPKKGQATT